MTTIEAVIAVLLADSDITAIVDTRIFPKKVPDGNELWPVIVLNEVSSTPVNTFAGTYAKRLNNVRLQLDCYAREYLPAKNLSELVDQVLVDSTDLTVWKQAGREFYEDETELHRVETDFSVWR